MFRRLDALPHRHVVTLPSEPSAVRLVRETAEQALVEWGIGLRHPAVAPALMILSELVTNSVRHAAVLSPQLTVIYAASSDCLAFAVHDRHPPPAIPVLLGHGDGRGRDRHCHGTGLRPRRHRRHPRRRRRRGQEHLDHSPPLTGTADANRPTAQGSSAS